MNTKYEIVIGLEIHAQMSTKTKLFCSCSNDSFNSKPNTNICEVCMGMPGVLPVLNNEALNKAIKAGYMLNCEIKKTSIFDRKNYFYPDLTKGYQITQLFHPICKNGKIDILNNNEYKSIRINRIHIEEDAGKLSHHGENTYCDYNRCGSPLMEIVTEPDIRSYEEAISYAKTIQKLLRASNSSDCDMEKGMMRFDVNISLRKIGEKKFGNKVEIKNLNSYRSMQKAIKYETKRQSNILESNGVIDQETRGWSDVKEITFSQRSKEQSNDYRYFPEPDLPPVILTKEHLDLIKSSMPESPILLEKRLVENFGLQSEDAFILTQDISLARMYEEIAIKSEEPKMAYTFVVNLLAKYLNEEKLNLNEILISQTDFIALIQAIKSGDLSNNLAKSVVFPEMLKTGKSPATIIEEKAIKSISDVGEIENICSEIINLSPELVEKYRNGKTNVLGYFTGQVMKKTSGQANPKIVNELLLKLLNK
jgi:aspartyl-tRNA(Asn)/glutamyl-tRNA(Gln) amidotransferase subunit B